MSNNLQALIAATAFAFTAATSHAMLVVNYEFNDPAGGLSTAVNSVGNTIGSWGDDPDATLNGAGQLVVAGQLNFQNRVLTGSNAVSSGTAFLRVDFDSWGSSNDPFFVFGMRGSGPDTGGNTSWRLQFSSGDSSDNDPLGRLIEVAGHSLKFNADAVPPTGFNFFEGGIPTTGGSNGLSVIMGIDLDNDTTSVWWDLDRTGNYEIAGGREDVPILTNGGGTDFSLIDGLQINASGGTFAVDRLAFGTSFASVAAIPEPSLVAAFGGLTAALASTVRRRSLRR